MEDQSVPSAGVTLLLDAAAAGDTLATERLFESVYGELRRIAGAMLHREIPGATLQPTALVNEAYLRLVGSQAPAWQSRAHFFGAAARAMRLILIDRARRIQAARRAGAPRQGGSDLPTLEGVMSPDAARDMLSLDEALERLRARDERQYEVVMLRFFAGLTIEETALALDLANATIKNEWSYARAWLMREIEQARDAEGGSDDRAGTSR